MRKDVCTHFTSLSKDAAHLNTIYSLSSSDSGIDGDCLSPLISHWDWCSQATLQHFKWNLSHQLKRLFVELKVHFLFLIQGNRKGLNDKQTLNPVKNRWKRFQFGWCCSPEQTLSSAESHKPRLQVAAAAATMRKNNCWQLQLLI